MKGDIQGHVAFTKIAGKPAFFRRRQTSFPSRRDTGLADQLNGVVTACPPFDPCDVVHRREQCKLETDGITGDGFSCPWVDFSEPHIAICGDVHGGDFVHEPLCNGVASDDIGAIKLLKVPFFVNRNGFQVFVQGAGECHFADAESWRRHENLKKRRR